MKHLYALSHLCVLWLLCAFCTACEYKELCYDHQHWMEVQIQFDWRDTVSRSQFSPILEKQGFGMTVLFYDEENPYAEPIRYDLSGRNGGTVRLTAGTYRAIAYNYDTETILYRGATLPTLEAYTRWSSIEEGTQLTRSGMPRAVGTEQEPVILEPDMLWCCTSEPFTIAMTNPTDGTASGNGLKKPIILRPQTRVHEVNIAVHNVPNLQYTGQFGGALSGLASSVWMETGELSNATGTQAFTCQVVDDTTLEMHFRIFGHCPNRSEGDLNAHQLTIYAILADGSKWFYTQDVTEQMHDITKNPEMYINPEHPDMIIINYNINIDIDGLPVPKPIVNGSGFQPTIDGWQGEEIEVKM